MTVLRALLPLLSLCLLSSVSAREHQSPSDQMVSVGTHRLELRRRGQGTPTVVIDAGVTDLLDNWSAVQERIAKFTHVMTYNRAGYGRSEPGPLPRDSGREARELRALLKQASVAGPYVVVGHSLGGLNAQVFSAKYPEDVAGIVLLDPPPLSFLRRKAYPDLVGLADQATAQWQAIADAGAQATDAQERARSAFFRMIASEHREMFGKSARSAAGISSFGDTPLLVMAAGKPNPAFGDLAEAYQAYWIEQSRSLAQKSATGKFVLAEGGTHHLYRDVPDLVVESILSVVYQARKEH